MPSSAPPPLPLPRCYVCDAADYCHVSRVGNELHVVLCHDHHVAFVEQCAAWLKARRTVAFGLPPKELEPVTLGPSPIAPPLRMLRALPNLSDALDQVPSKPHGKGEP